MSANSIVRHEATVQLLGGLHLRPASIIAGLVGKSGCRVRILNGSKTADASDVFDLIALEARPQAKLTLELQGDGAAELLAEILPLLEQEDAGPVKPE